MGRRLLFLVLIALLIFPLVYAEGSNTTLGFAGSILDVTTGNYTKGASITNITANISTSASCNSNVIYSEKFVNNVSGGVFSLLAGYYEEPLNLYYGMDYWSCYEITNGTFTEVFGADPFTSGKGLIEPEDINDTATYTIYDLLLKGGRVVSDSISTNFLDLDDAGTVTLNSSGNINLRYGLTDGVQVRDETNDRVMQLTKNLILQGDVYWELDVDKRLDFSTHANQTHLHPSGVGGANYWIWDSRGTGDNSPLFYPSSDNEAQLGSSGRRILEAWITGLRLETNLWANKIINMSDPTDAQDAATKNYVDNAVSSTAFDFFFTNLTSDIANHFNMSEGDLGLPESTLDSASRGAGTFSIFNFTSIQGQPEFNELRSGIYDVHTHLNKTGTKPVTITPKLYNISSDGTVRDLLITFETSAPLTTSPIGYTLHGILVNTTMLSSGNRLNLELEATVGATGSNVIITSSQEGTTDSHLTIETSSSAFDAIFLRQDGTKNLTGNWNFGSKNITGAGTVIVNNTEVVCTAENGLCNQSTKEFFVPVSWGTGTEGNTGDFYRWNLPVQSGQTAHINFYVPQDMTSITNAVVIIIVGGAGGGLQITADIQTDFGAAFEAYNTHSTASGAIGIPGLTANDIVELPLITTNMAVGDYVGVQVVESGLALFDVDFDVIGVRLEYN